MGKGSILCIDDDEAVLEMITETLAESGYDAIAYSSPIEALDSLKRGLHAVSLVIADIVMPGLTGAELAKAVHALMPQTPVILITGYQQVIRTELTAEVKAAGVKLILTKPFTESELSEAVARTIREQAAPASA